jgi:DNA gyrase subunit A
VHKSPVVSVLEVNADDELLVTTTNGVVIRCSAEDIRETSRNTKGVRIQRLEESDRVSAVVRVIRSEKENATFDASPAPQA